MKRADQQRILHDVFSDEIAAARAASLSAGLQTLRRGRQRRLAIASTAGLLACAAIIALWFRDPATPPALPSSKVAAIDPGPRSVRIINDAELAALFRDRPFALIGSPGDQRLVFLDEQPSTSGRPSTSSAR